jgi:murein DD-endopeptidase MepM/ murein hydrolase activator NlpD
MRPCAKQWKITFPYGELYPPELQYLTADKKHHGIDYGCIIGTSVIAPVNGIVNFKGFKRGFGNCVYIKFWTGYWPLQHVYRVILAHLSQINEELVVGDRITKWTEIGKSGDSGMASNHPHLHCEVQDYIEGVWVAVNPSFVVGKS